MKDFENPRRDNPHHLRTPVPGMVGAWNGKSIPSFYNGVTFRSRTEARWAVFMDQLGVRWMYEHEGFELPSGRYVPDFWLPQMGRYLEIKPSCFVPFAIRDGQFRDSEEVVRMQELVAHTKRELVLFLGSPGEQGPALNGSPYGSASGHETGIIFTWGGPPDDDGIGGVGSDFPYLWCRCPVCHRVGIEFDGRGGRVDSCATTDKDYSYDDPEILVAYKTSECWRFQ